MVQPAHVLLVEDNPNDVELTLRALDRHDLATNVEVARDGVAALDYLLSRGPHAARDVSHQPNLVLLDLKLPKVNGHEVIRRMRADERTRSTPIVVLTSSAEDRDVVESYELGANSYVVKPIEFDDFVRAISEVGLYWLVLNEPPR